MHPGLSLALQRFEFLLSRISNWQTSLDGEKILGHSMRRVLTRLVDDQRVRFLAVGATNTVVGYLIFAALTTWFLRELPLGYLLSLVASYAIAIFLAFFLYRRFVFHVSGHVLADFLRFVGVYAVAISINLVALPLLVEIVHVHALLAQAVILVVTTLVSFFGHKSFSFRRTAAQRVGPAAEQDHS